MYLPLELNSPALVGGFIAHFLTRRSEQVGGEPGRTMRERGVVIASGLLAGGALGGVFGAALRMVPGFREDWIKTARSSTPTPISQPVSLVAFAGALRLPLVRVGEARQDGRGLRSTPP